MIYNQNNKTKRSRARPASSNKNFANTRKKQQGMVSLQDPTKTTTITESIYNKTNLRTFLQRPVANAERLREVSRFLYNRSQLYRRIIQYNAGMIDMNFRQVIPIIDGLKENNPEDLKKSFFETSKMLEHMNLASEFYKAFIVAWREDVFFGCAYLDDETFFILPLDAKYCKTVGFYPDASLAFCMDMSYFDSNPELAELWGAPFDSMYKEYQKDTTNNKWQTMPEEHSVCLKVNIENWRDPIPPYVGLFNNLINLEDLAEIQQVAEESRIYKLIVAKIPLLKNTTDVNDFALDLDDADEYFSRMADELPPYVAAVESPMDLTPIEFDRDQTNDVGRMESATKSILTISGGVQTLCPTEGATAFTAAIKADEEYALSSLLPQTEAILNRLVGFAVKNAAKIRMLKITRYTKAEYKAELIKDMNFGTPNALTLTALSGFSELESISQAHLQEALGINELFKPLQTAATQTGDSEDEGGRPTKEANEPLSDKGEKARDRTDQLKKK